MIIQLDRSRMLVGLRIQETQHPSVLHHTVQPFDGASYLQQLDIPVA